MYLSQEDRHAYGEGIRRGGFLLCAEIDSGEDADKIIRLLEESSSVDMDERQNSWRSEGWSPQAATGKINNAAVSMSGSAAAMSGSAGSTSATGCNVVSEEHIPIVEEELRIDREGGRSLYGRDRPVLARDVRHPQAAASGRKAGALRRGACGCR